MAFSDKEKTTRLPHDGRKAGGSTPVLFFLVLLLFSACARMGHPDGGWYDETPPRVIGAVPEDKAVNVDTRKFSIYFNEYIKLEGATEKVVVSPPQIEMPEIVGKGKYIKIELLDSLKPNTTYTIDFSDAISDNNEGNPLGNYTYSFSTGDHIDTMEVSGFVLNAADLEPVKGILVGLYDNLDDSVFTTKPLMRVSRTDSRGHFVIKGVAPGKYRTYALQDVDNDYTFSQKSEMIAFNHDIIEPSWKPDIRQDTIWRDSLRIDSIMRVPYTHFLPDDIVLRAFTESMTTRYLVKRERKQANSFSYFFSYGCDSLPKIRGLNFNDSNAFVVEPSLKGDTITYWLRDSTLINQDSLTIESTYLISDSTGALVSVTDTVTMLSKEPYQKRLKQKEKEFNEWKKKQEKAEKRGEPFEKEMPVPPLTVKPSVTGEMAPDENVSFSFDVPIDVADTSKVHLYSKHDSLWYKVPFIFREKKNQNRTYELLAEWRPDVEYSIEMDSAAFVSIYGLATAPFKQGLKIKSLDAFSTLVIPVSGMPRRQMVAELLNAQESVVKRTKVQDGVIEFFYVIPGTYYLRLFVDLNENGVWDTGCYDDDLQPEAVYYYPDQIECKEKWDHTLSSWNPEQINVAQQKPKAIVKQKAEKEKTIRHRNAERAKELGIEFIKENIPY